MVAVVMVLVMMMVVVVMGCWRGIVDGGRRGVDDGRWWSVVVVIVVVMVRVRSVADGVLLGADSTTELTHEWFRHFTYSDAAKDAVMVVMMIVMRHCFTFCTQLMSAAPSKLFIRTIP